jgi:hypothetical protein
MNYYAFLYSKFFSYHLEKKKKIKTKFLIYYSKKYKNKHMI